MWALAMLGGVVFLWRTIQAQSANRQPPSGPTSGGSRRNGREARVTSMLEVEEARQDDMVGLPSRT